MTYSPQTLSSRWWQITDKVVANNKKIGVVAINILKKVVANIAYLLVLVVEKWPRCPKDYIYTTISQIGLYLPKLWAKVFVKAWFLLFKISQVSFIIIINFNYPNKPESSTSAPKGYSQLSCASWYRYKRSALVYFEKRGLTFGQKICCVFFLDWSRCFVDLGISNLIE